MADSGGLYSLLGQVTTSQYKRDAREERKYRKDLERDRLKAVLLQPLIGAAATTGMQAVTDILGSKFLEGGGRSFSDTENGRALDRKLISIRTQMSSLQKEYENLNTPDAYQKMVKRLSEEKIADLGGKVTDEQKASIYSHFGSVSNKDNVLSGINDAKSSIMEQLVMFSKAPTDADLASRLKNTKYYDGKSKLSKLFSTGWNKLLGRDMDTIKASSLNYLLTGSEDENFTTEIAELLKDPSNKGLNALALQSQDLLKADDNFVLDSLQRIEKENPDFYRSVRGKIKEDTLTYLSGLKFFKRLDNLANVHSDSLLSTFTQTDLYRKSKNNNNPSELRESLGKYIFSADQGEFKGFKNKTRLNKDFTRKKAFLLESLGIASLKDKADRDQSTSVKNVDNALDYTLDEAFNVFSQLATQGKTDPLTGDITGSILTNSTEEQVRLAIKKYALDTEINVSDISGVEDKQVYLSSESKEDRQQRFLRTLEEVKNENYSTNSRENAENIYDEELLKEFNSTLTGENVTTTQEAVNKLNNNPYLTVNEKRELVKKISIVAVQNANEVVDNSLNDSSVASAIIEDISTVSRNIEDNLLSIFPRKSDAVALDEKLEINRTTAITDIEEKSDLIDSLTEGYDLDSSLRIRNALVASNFNPKDKQVTIAIENAVTEKPKSSLLFKDTDIREKQNLYVDDPEEQFPRKLDIKEPSPRKDSLLANKDSEPDSYIYPLINDASSLIPDNDKFKPLPIDVFKTILDIESNPEQYTTLAKRNKAFSKHAYGIGQIKTATAVSPGYGVPNIFKTADELGIEYDTNLKAEAVKQQKTNAANNNGVKPITGKAGKEVVRLLEMSNVNVTFSYRFLSRLYGKYNGDLEKTLLGYNQGPGVADKWDGNRKNIPSKNLEGFNYLVKFDNLFNK